MIPTKGKKYAIACLGPFEYNQWKGIAEYNGNIEPGTNSDGSYEDWYEFIREDGQKIVLADEDIIAEIL